MLLAVTDLSITLPLGPRGAAVPVLDAVSLTLDRGERLGIVGESGSGKTLLALALLGLLPTGAKVSGAIHVDGCDLLTLTPAARQAYRGKRIGMVFQEPMTALHPMLTIGDQIGEAITLHQGLRGSARRSAVLDLLEQVHLPDAARRIDAFPHELSGGQRQRIGLAIALAGTPDLLIADEPTTALDVTVQRAILGLLHELTAARRLALLLVSHDLGVVGHLTQRLLALYAGRVAEEGPTQAVLAHPRHPYLRGLRAAVPSIGQVPVPIPGTLPPPSARGRGCRFAPRCPEAGADCAEPPPLRPIVDRRVACWRVGAA